MNQFLENISRMTQWEYLLRIMVACLCGGAIGIERTLRQKDAGFRTHVIVALGSALMMIVSKYGFFDVIGYDSVNLDASRVAANIITGISFLGAGMIFVRGGTIKGLTTAAGIWSTAAVSMAIGGGMYFIGIASTMLLVLIQIVFHMFLIGQDKVLAHDTTTEMVVKIVNSPDAISSLKKWLEGQNIAVTASRVESVSHKTLLLVMTVKCDRRLDMHDSLEILNSNPEVRSVSL